MKTFENQRRLPRCPALLRRAGRGRIRNVLLAAMTVSAAVPAGRANGQCSIVIRHANTTDSLGLPALAFVDDVAIGGTRLYMYYSELLDEDYHLATIDISNPNSPSLLGISPPVPNSLSQSVAIGNNYICILSGNLQVYSTDNPNNPVVIGSLNLPGGIQALRLSGGFIFAGSGGHVDVIDVSDPTNPIVIETLSTTSGRDLGNPVRGIMPGWGNGNLILIDVSDPANLSIISTTPVIMPDPSIVGNAVVSMDNTNVEIDILDISDPANPVALPSFPDPADTDEPGAEIRSHLTAATERYFYGIATFPQGFFNSGTFYAIDFADPTMPVVASTNQPTDEGEPSSMTLLNNLLVGTFLGEFAIMGIDSCLIPPSIVGHPSSQATTEGGDPVQLDVQADLMDVAYRWFHDGQPLTDDAVFSGTDTAALSIGAVLDATGEYTVEVLNADGSETSQTAVVGVRPGVPAASGACCLSLGDCVVVTAAECTAVAGTYQGDATTCAMANCPTHCLGDLNVDGSLDALDTQMFVAALLSGAVCP